MRRALVTLVVAALAIAAAALARSRLGGAEPVAVETVRAERRALASALELTGEVINDRTVTITALLDGEIVGIGAREGEAVDAGDTLATLDNRFAATELDRARAELGLARQRLASATREDERARRLSSGAELSRRAVDDAADALARARLELRVAEAEVRLVELRVENATVAAPFAGTVIDRSAETGQWVEAGTPLFELVASDGDVIEARVDAGDASRVAIGQPVALSSDAWPGRTWSSEVVWISPDVTGDDVGANRFSVRAPLGDGAPALKLGERVDVSLELERVEGALVLPLEALEERAPGRYRVRTVETGAVETGAVETGAITGTVRTVDVEVGLITIDDAEILGGLDAGALAIVPAGGPPPASGAEVRVVSGP